MNKERSSLYIKIMYILGILVNIKSVLIDYDGDAGYAFAMASRLINGDKMFTEMWEPHQTAAVFTAAFMKLYYVIFGTTDGVVLFLNITTFLIYLLLTVFAVRTLSKFVDKTTSEMMGIILLVLRPKIAQTLDYANLTIIFSTAFFILLIKYFAGERRLTTLILSAVFLCLNVLAYPTAIVLYIALAVCIFVYSNHKLRDFLVTSGTCLILGGAYGGYFLAKIGFKNLIECLKNIVSADSHSGESVYTGLAYFKEFVIGVFVILLCVVLAYTIHFILKRAGRNSSFEVILALFYTVFVIAESYLVPIMVNDDSLAIWSLDRIFLFALAVFGAFGYRYLNSVEKVIYTVGMIVSISTFASVLLLTNLPFITAFGYLHVAAMVSIMSLSLKAQRESKENNNKISYICVASLIILLFAQGRANVTKAENYIRTGPRKWCISTLQDCNGNKIGVAEWKESVTPDDTVLIIKTNGIDPVSYMYSGSAIAVHSTISTPTYGDGLEKYWEYNPNKIPTVVAIPCWEGTEGGNTPEWLRKMINEEYALSKKGTLWNFYKRK